MSDRMTDHDARLMPGERWQPSEYADRLADARHSPRFPPGWWTLPFAACGAVALVWGAFRLGRWLL